VIGFVHVKDVLGPVADRRPARLERLLRKVLYVAPSLPILDLLVQMRQARTHIAVVVDEFGGIDGLVTIEDLIEEIVGDIEDEHDVPETPTLIERPDGSIIADARLPIEALEEQHGIALRSAGDEETVDTLGGLVFTLAGRVPKRGEVIVHPDGIEFEVLDADPRRVKRLRIGTRKERPAARQREARRREAVPDPGSPQDNDNISPPPTSDGAGSP
jgi:CBS domain containing-hemolysin-like protein